MNCDYVNRLERTVKPRCPWCGRFVTTYEPEGGGVALERHYSPVPPATAVQPCAQGSDARIDRPPTYEQAKAAILLLDANEFEALSMAALDRDGRLRPSRFTRLQSLGLVERYMGNVYGTGNSPIDRVPVTVQRFRVPVTVHMAWAESCAAGGNTTLAHPRSLRVN